MKPKRLVTIAMLVAMYVVLSLFGTIRLGSMNISVASLPIIVGGALFGPIDGLLIGLLGSFMEQMLTYGITVTTPLWMIPATVRGLMVGAFAKHHGFEMSFKQTQFITILSALVVTAINTVVMYLDAKIYGYYTFAGVFGMVVPRIIFGVITAFILGALLTYIEKPLRNYLAK